VKPFYSTALGQLIKWAADFGFTIKEKERTRYIRSAGHETSFLCHINKKGVPISPNHQTLLKEKRYPVF